MDQLQLITSLKEDDNKCTGKETCSSITISIERSGNLAITLSGLMQRRPTMISGQLPQLFPSPQRFTAGHHLLMLA